MKAAIQSLWDSLTKPKPIAKLRAEARYEANKQYLEFQAAAEDSQVSMQFNQLKADMFRTRVLRLDAEDEAEKRGPAPAPAQSGPVELFEPQEAGAFVLRAATRARRS